jgi:hypothetical protein
MVITIGGSAWTGTHIAEAFGVVCFLSCVIAAGNPRTRMKRVRAPYPQ